MITTASQMCTYTMLMTVNHRPYRKVYLFIYLFILQRQRHPNDLTEITFLKI